MFSIIKSCNKVILCCTIFQNLARSLSMPSGNHDDESDEPMASFGSGNKLSGEGINNGYPFVPNGDPFHSSKNKR